MAFYLVERYVPSMSAADVEAAIARVDELTGPVRHIWTILVASEDTCLSVFEGPDAAAIEAANMRAAFQVDRIVEVTALEPPEPAPQGSVVPRMRGQPINR